MRWALIGLALLLAVAGLLYRGGVAFVSSFSGATASASRGVDGPGTVATTTGQLEAPMRPDRSTPAEQGSASGMPRSDPSPATPQPAVVSNSEDPSPGASEQRVFRSRRALETIDPHELLRQGR
jgi:hypothetical protein